MFEWGSAMTLLRVLLDCLSFVLVTADLFGANRIAVADAQLRARIHRLQAMSTRRRIRRTLRTSSRISWMATLFVMTICGVIVMLAAHPLEANWSHLPHAWRVVIEVTAFNLVIVVLAAFAFGWMGLLYLAREARRGGKPSWLLLTQWLACGPLATFATWTLADAIARVIAASGWWILFSSLASITTLAAIAFVPAAALKSIAVIAGGLLRLLRWRQLEGSMLIVGAALFFLARALELIGD